MRQQSEMRVPIQSMKKSANLTKGGVLDKRGGYLDLKSLNITRVLKSAILEGSENGPDYEQLIA